MRILYIRRKKKSNIMTNTQRYFFKMHIFYVILNPEAGETSSFISSGKW
jgi:hypothetical protein